MTTSPVSESHTTSRADSSGPPTYRFSVLLAGAHRMWRGTRVALPVIVINALAQGLLVLPTQSAYSGWALAVTALASAVVLLVTVGLLVAAGLDSYPPATPTWASTRRRLSASGWAYAAWTSALFIASVVGLALWTWPGFVVLAAGLFVPVCAADGVPPVQGTWAIVRRRPVRWAVTVGVTLVLGTLAFLLTAALWFFVPLFTGVVIAGLLWGLLMWWWTTALAGLHLGVRRSGE